jgi:hypothetical protein
VTSITTVHRKSRCRYECSKLHRTVLAGKFGEFSPKGVDGRSTTPPLVFEN